MPFFNSGSREFLEDIVVKLKFEVYLTGEYICVTGRKGDKMYFIQRGIVDVFTKDGELATSLGDGSHFGGTFKGHLSFRWRHGDHMREFKINNATAATTPQNLHT